MLVDTPLESMVTSSMSEPVVVVNGVGGSGGVGAFVGPGNVVCTTGLRDGTGDGCDGFGEGSGLGVGGLGERCVVVRVDASEVDANDSGCGVDALVAVGVGGIGGEVI